MINDEIGECPGLSRGETFNDEIFGENENSLSFTRKRFFHMKVLTETRTENGHLNMWEATNNSRAQWS